VKVMRKRALTNVEILNCNEKEKKHEWCKDDGIRVWHTIRILRQEEYKRQKCYKRRRRKDETNKRTKKQKKQKKKNKEYGRQLLATRRKEEKDQTNTKTNEESRKEKSTETKK
jgi:hypothetical protein